MRAIIYALSAFAALWIGLRVRTSRPPAPPEGSVHRANPAAGPAAVSEAAPPGAPILGLASEGTADPFPRTAAQEPEVVRKAKATMAKIQSHDSPAAMLKLHPPPETPRRSMPTEDPSSRASSWPWTTQGGSQAPRRASRKDLPRQSEPTPVQDEPDPGQ